MSVPLFLIKKPVDWSLLIAGFNIPLEFQPLVHGLYDKPIAHGEKKNIKILIEGKSYDAVLTNINFNQIRFTRKDLLQIRYSLKSPIALKLQTVFQPTYRYLKDIKEQQENKRRPIQLSENCNEYITLYSTEQRDVFLIECFTTTENQLLSQEVKKYQEQEYEMLQCAERTDGHAGYVDRITKVRMLDQSIGESLKRLYNNCCQITGEKIGEKYGQEVIEAPPHRFFHNVSQQ